MTYLKLSWAALLSFALLTITGCSPQPKHPNQLNAFDGVSFDSLTVAHASLSSLRGTVASTYPQYIPVYNQAATAYGVAYKAYADYRMMPANPEAITVALANLTVSIVSLEDTIQADLHVTAHTVTSARGKVQHLRAAAQQQHITISDILTELEIAASIAQTVPGTQPYSTLAAIVIRSTQAAVAALSSGSGQPIDLTTIQPIALI